MHCTSPVQCDGNVPWCIVKHYNAYWSELVSWSSWHTHITILHWCHALQCVALIVHRIAYWSELVSWCIVIHQSAYWFELVSWCSWLGSSCCLGIWLLGSSPSKSKGVVSNKSSSSSSNIWMHIQDFFEDRPPRSLSGWWVSNKPSSMRTSSSSCMNSVWRIWRGTIWKNQSQ